MLLSLVLFSRGLLGRELLALTVSLERNFEYWAYADLVHRARTT